MLGEQNISKRECQSMALLQKLIRLDSKDCNFHFRDVFRGVYFKISYPITSTDNNSNEGLLRQLWHHVWAHYFRRLEQQELKRVNYVSSIFSEVFVHRDMTNGFRNRLCNQDRDFLMQMEILYDPSYFQMLMDEVQKNKQLEIWVKSLQMNIKMINLQEKLEKQQKKKSRLIYSKLKQNRKHRRMLKAKKILQKSLKQDEQQIDQFLSQLRKIQSKNKSQIDREIQQLENQLYNNSVQSKKIVDELQKKVNLQIQNYESKGFPIVNGIQYSENSSKDLECLQYLISCLQEKQIAESVSKIISTQRSKGQIMFQIAYQKAINIQPRLINQRQLNRINFLRQTSLIQFYRTGVKSPYSYICHNYVGFRELMQNRLNITTKFKDKCIFQMMKKGACLASIGQIQNQMNKFNTCHHCKFLLPDYLLFTCKFTSDKQAIPKVNLQTINDPNLVQKFQQGPNKSRTSQRFMTRKKNCLTSYAKVHDQYVCGRKYCFSCIKDTYYHENIRQSGLCPFCLGVCVCTRCLRNEKIAKFKNMYTSLGGDITKIQENSDLQQLQTKGEQLIQRGRGRPKKYLNSHLTINLVQTKLRKFDQKQNYLITSYTKNKRRGNFNTLWKKNDSANQTYEQSDPKKKRKRGVGRPRTDKISQQYKMKVGKANDR